MRIAGDIGGTKTNLALFQKEGEEILYFSSFPSKEYSNLTDILLEFYNKVLSKDERALILSATFAIAGPVQEGVCRATNLPWVVEVKELEQKLGIKDVYLINDLEANAYALEILSPKDLQMVHPGNSGASGNRAVISPGTGLGEAGVYFDGKGYHPFACEGGHTDFGPIDHMQLDLCRYLFDQFGHASYERLLSGPGLYNIYLFLRDVVKMEEPYWLKERMLGQDSSQVISEEGLKKSCALCMCALDLFVSILAAEASNCVLKFMATGGLYIGGGIAPKILPKFKEATFLEAFLNKGRFRDLLQRVPIFVILNDKASLMGAAYFGEIEGRRKNFESPTSFKVK